MISEYSKIACQNVVRQHMQDLTLNMTMEKYSCDISHGSEKLRKTMTTFSPQSPKCFRSEKATVEYLLDVETGYEWAKSALAQCCLHDSPWSFLQLYTALDAAWLQVKQHKEIGRKKLTHSNKANSICWKSQGVYRIS